MNNITVSFLCATAFIMSACAGNPSSPSPAPLPTVALETTTTDPAVAPTPDAAVPAPDGMHWTTTGGQPCGSSPSGIRSWTVAVSDAGPAPVRAVYLAHHDEQANCTGTIDNPRPIVGVAGPRTYAAHASGQTQFTFDTHAYSCGRVQVDVSFLDEQGHDTLVLGEVINYGRDCVASPAAPAAPAPPTPPVAAPVPPVAPPSATPTIITPTDACPAGVTGQITRLTPGGTATAVITVPAGQSLTASFVSYEAPGLGENRYPQTVIHGQQTLQTGSGKTTFTIPVPGCYYQVDLVCGAPLPQITETIRYGTRRLDSRHGGSQVCR